MQGTTETKKKKSKAPVICAALVIAVLAFYLLAVICPLLGEACHDVLGIGFLVLYFLIICAVAVGVLLALRQRLKEIRDGEEEEAAKY